MYIGFKHGVAWTKMEIPQHTYKQLELVSLVAAKIFVIVEGYLGVESI
jgi:hypothetical protein